MLISIITINYNNVIGLENTLNSVFSQTYKDFEYIVIDGGSLDGSVDIIQKSAERLTYYVSEPDHGIYDAMNKGISKATGHYLMFLNSGDYLLGTEILKRCVNYIKKNECVDIFYGDIEVANDKRRTENWIKSYPSELSLDFFRSDTINHQASFIKSILFREYGLYPKNIKLASDYWLFLKCLLNNKIFYHFNFPIVVYDLGGITGLNYSAYLQEKQSVWKTLVSKCIQQVIDERDYFKNMYKGRIMRAAMLLNRKLQSIKNKVSK